MAGSNNAAPVIIKRKKIVAGEGHHGGAWKVAYADFVTAMMAFFLLMWLLGATTEKQRKGVADYFNPTVTVSTSGGGEGVLGGDAPMPEETGHTSGTGVAGGRVLGDGPESDGARLKEVKAEIDRLLTAFGGESMTMQRALRHVVTRVTDEGVVLEIHDLPDAPLFQSEGAMATPVLHTITDAMAEALGITQAQIAVNGHVRAYPVVLADNPVWTLSAARAETVRQRLQDGGLAPGRVQRVVGHADRRPVTADPMAARNNRIEVVLLREDR